MDAAHWSGSLAVSARRVRSYLANYRALLAGAVRGQMPSVCAVVALNALGVAGRGGVIAIVAYFVSLIESGAVHEIPYLGIRIGNDPRSVALLGGAVFLVALTSALATYQSSILSRRLARGYHVRLARTVLAAVANHRQRDTGDAALSRQQITIHVMRNARQTGIAVETIFNMVQPAFYALVALVAAFALDSLLSASLIPVALVAGPLVYRLSARIQSDSSAFFDTHSRAMGQVLGATARELDSGSIVQGPVNRIDEAFARSPVVTGFLDCLDRFQLAGERMTLLISILRAIALALVLSLFGTLALTGARSWAAIVAYVGALFYLLNGVQTLFVLNTSLSRFYPQAMALKTFIDAAGREVSSAGALPVPAVARVVVCARNAAGKETSLELGPGSRCFYWSPCSLSRARYLEFVKPLQGAAGEGGEVIRNADFLAASHQFTRGSFLENLIGFSADPRAANEVREFLAGSRERPAVASILALLDREVTSEAWLALGDEERARMQLVQMKWGKAAVLFVDVPFVRRLSPKVREEILGFLAPKILIIICDDGEIPEGCADTVLVTAEDGSLSVGTVEWFRRTRKNLRKRDGAEEAGALGVDETLL